MPEENMMKRIKQIEQITEYYSPVRRTFFYDGDPLILSECKEYYRYLKEENVRKGSILSNKDKSEMYAVLGASLKGSMLFGLVVVRVKKTLFGLRIKETEIKTINLEFIKTFFLHVTGKISSLSKVDFVSQYIRPLTDFYSSLSLISTLQIGDLYKLSDKGPVRILLITEINENIEDIECVLLPLSSIKGDIKEFMVEHNLMFLPLQFVPYCELKNLVKIDHFDELFVTKLKLVKRAR